MFDFDDFEMNDFDSPVCGQDDLINLEQPIDCALASPSFKGYGQIDELYNPHIVRAEDNFSRHLDDFSHARSQFEIDQAKHALQRDISDHKFWEDAKRAAEIEHQKDQAFLDHIRNVDEILDKYRK